jgi:putative ABC transport system permease protein
MLGLVLSGIRRLGTRYAALAIVLALSTAASVFGSLVGSYATAASGAGATGTASLRSISVYPDRETVTDDSVAAFRGIPGVESAAAFIRVPAGMQSTGADLSLIGLTGQNPPPILAGTLTPAPGGNPSIVLPATAGSTDFRGLVGSTVELTFTVAVDAESGTTSTRRFRVTGVSDPAYQVDAPHAAYIDGGLARELFLLRLGIQPSALADAGGYEKASVQVLDQGQVPEVTAALQQLGYQAVSRLQEVDAVPGVISLIRVATGVLAVGLLAVSAISALVLTLSLARQRTRELAVLRTVGWAARRVLGLWTAEVAIVAGLSVAVGSAAGIATGTTLGNSLRASLAQGQLGPVVPDAGSIAGIAALFMVLAVVPAALVILHHARRDVASILRTI